MALRAAMYVSKRDFKSVNSLFLIELPIELVDPLDGIPSLEKNAQRHQSGTSCFQIKQKS